MADIKLKAIIEANASGLKEALTDIEQKSGSAGKSFRESFGAIAQDVRVAEDAVKALSESTKGMSADEIKSLGVDFGALEKCVSASGAKISDMLSTLADLRRESSQVGTSFEDWQMLVKAAGDAGVGVDTLKTALAHMQEQIAGLANGVPEAVGAFGKLGLTMEQLGSMSQGERLAAISNAILGTIPSVDQAKAAMEMYGVSIDQVSDVSLDYQNIAHNTPSGTFATDRDVSTLTRLASAMEKIASQSGGLASVISRDSDEMRKAQEDFDQAAEALNRYYDVRESRRRNGEFDDQADMIDDLLKKYDELIERKREALDTAMQRLSASDSDDAPEAEAAYRNAASDYGQSKLRKDILELKTYREELERYFSVIGGGRMVSEEDISAIREMSDAIGAIRNEFQALSIDSENGSLEIDTGDLEEGYSLLEQMESKWGDVAHVSGVVEQCNEELARRIDEQRNGVSILGALWRGVKSAMDACMHPVESIKSGVKEASGWLGRWKGLAGGSSGELKKLSGQLLGVGSQAVLIAKAFKEVVGYFRELNELNGWTRGARDMAKASASIANANGMAGVSDEGKSRADSLQRDLSAYRDLWRKSQKSGSTFEDQEAVRQAREALDRNYGMDLKGLGTGGGLAGLDKEISSALKSAQSQRLGQVETELEMLRKANADIDTASRSHMQKWRDATGTEWTQDALVGGMVKGAGGAASYVLDSQTMSVLTGSNDRLKEFATQRGANEKRIEQLMSERRQLKEGDWSGDYSRMQSARDADERYSRSETKAREVKEWTRKGRTVEDAMKYEQSYLESMVSGATTAREVQQAYDDYRRNVARAINSYEKEEIAALDKETKAQLHGADPTQRAQIRSANAEKLKAIQEKYLYLWDDVAKRLGDHRSALYDAWKDEIDAYGNAAKDYRDAQKSYDDALKDMVRTQRDIADEKRREREDERNARIDRKKARYGFDLPDGFDINESAKDRRKRKENAKIDEGISGKMSKWQEGEDVRFTDKERRRIAGLQGLLDEQERMERRKERREDRRRMSDREESLGKSREALANAGSALGLAAQSLYSAGVNLSAVQGQAVNYSGMLGTLHTDLQALGKGVRIVK